VRDDRDIVPNGRPSASWSRWLNAGAVAAAFRVRLVLEQLLEQLLRRSGCVRLRPVAAAAAREGSCEALDQLLGILFVHVLDRVFDLICAPAQLLDLVLERLGVSKRALDHAGETGV